MPALSTALLRNSSCPTLGSQIHGSGNRSVWQWSAIISRTTRLLVSKDQRLILVPGYGSSRSLAQVRSESFSDLWFTASFPTSLRVKQENGETVLSTHVPEPSGNQKDHKPLDERTLKLGKTLRKLSPLLPTILTTPLPSGILSPNVTLHLFPSTHPHLPVVRGRVPCRAALWTAPVAWGSVPIVGNVKLEIQSEKMVRTGFVSAPVSLNDDHDGLGEEKFVVRWRTEKRASDNGVEATKLTGSSSAIDGGGINRGLSTLLGGSQPLLQSTSSEPFTGLLVFSFDKDGKIASITIEHVDESHGFDKTSRVVTLTDWLLGKAKWSQAKDEAGLIPGLAMNTSSHTRRIMWLRNDRKR